MARSRDFADANFPSGTINRNVVIGGDFDTNPWQRGVSFTGVGSNKYTADRWSYAVAGSPTGVFTVQKQNLHPTAAESGHGGTYCLDFDVTTADTAYAAGDAMVLVHHVEGYNTQQFGFGKAGTRYVTLSFWHRHDTAGTYCGALRNLAGDRSWVFEYSQSTGATWEKAEITVPVDTGGTWNEQSNRGVSITFSLGSGSTWQATKDQWSTGNFWTTSSETNNTSSIGNSFMFALVQLEAGEVATKFESRDAGTELALCHRYYWSNYGVGDYPGDSVASPIYLANVYSGNTLYVENISLPVPMRADPTVATYPPSWGGTGSNWTYHNQTNWTAGTPVATVRGEQDVELYSTALTKANGTATICGGFITCDAEL
jgi:hypothetical protein